MKNMGLSRLKLVSPADPRDPESRMMAVSAFDLVEQASIYDSVEAALAEEHVVAGTTSFRGRKGRTRIDTPRAVAGKLLETARSQRVAILFGPERSGLNEAELALCQYLLSIPADPGFPTLNLAQAVLIVCYELYTREEDDRSGEDLPVLASQEELGGMYAHLERTLVNIGFLSTSNPGHIMRSIRRLLSKSEMTPRDVKILRGIARQMDWYIEQGRELPPERVRKP
jgi:tRNA/rRNA methyltransferase